MAKYFHHMYLLDCKSFYYINQYFNHRLLNPFFRNITHLGGATITISIVICLLLLSSGVNRLTALASAISLAASHIPVAIVKKMYPRKRPYLVLENCRVMNNPLTDCSFPSGHTTAVFSVIIPFICLYPMLSIILLPIGFFVATSRVYLGLHYPSDVLVGSLLGSLSGLISFIFVHNILFV